MLGTVPTKNMTARQTSIPMRRYKNSKTFTSMSEASLLLAVVKQLKWSLSNVSQGSDGLVKGLLNLNVQWQRLLYLTYYKLIRLV